MDDSAPGLILFDCFEFKRKLIPVRVMLQPYLPDRATFPFAESSGPLKPAIRRAYVKNSEKSNGNNDHKKAGTTTRAITTALTTTTIAIRTTKAMDNDCGL